MPSDDDLRPLSALQHLLYCPRQCALIHLEQSWAENVATTEGKHLHHKADRGRGEKPKCERCSLIDLCLPTARKSASGYLQRQLTFTAASDDPFENDD